MPVFVPAFLENTNWAKWCILSFHNLNRTHKTLKPLFFCRNLVFVAKQQTSSCFWVVEKKKRNFFGHTGVFWCKKWFCLKKQTDDVCKYYFLQVFKVFALDVLTLSLFSWLVVFLIFLFGFSFTSSCCFTVQVSMFWLLFHVVLFCGGILYVCFLFCSFFFLLLLEGLRVR